MAFILCYVVLLIISLAYISYKTNTYHLTEKNSKNKEAHLYLKITPAFHIS